MASWRNVLDCKFTLRQMNDYGELAIKLGYKMIAWNGRVYSIEKKSESVIGSYLNYQDLGTLEEHGLV